MLHIPQGQGAGLSSATIRTASPGRNLITRTNFPYSIPPIFIEGLSLYLSEIRKGKR